MDKDAIVPEDLPDALTALLPAYLARQRWYAGGGRAPSEARVVSSGLLVPPGTGSAQATHRVLWAIVEAGDASYQLFIGERPTSEVTEHKASADEVVIGSAGDRTFYDATSDPEMALEILGAVSGGQEEARLARPVGAEQSNTSIVYDDRLILKLFRRLSAGPNPDVEVTAALAASGFTHVALPLVRWQRGGRDLAFGQQYLAGGTDGWALALTSLRDYYATSATNGPPDPAQSGGDFAAEAARLGQMTAEMHEAMAEAFEVADRALARAWSGFVEALAAQVSLLHPSLVEGSGPLFAALRAVRDPGPAVRVHGDYHLGQVMRTDGGWYVLDFEGEPARPLEKRLQPTSVLKDVAGMLRSLQYAARFVLDERNGEESSWLEPMVRAWEDRNRRAFLRGYYDHKGIDSLLPVAPKDREAVRVAFELEKAMYELAYEEAHRPGWARIPLAALHRLLLSPVDELLLEGSEPPPAGPVEPDM